MASLVAQLSADRTPGLHLLAYSYGDWFEIFPPNHLMMLVLDADRANKEGLRLLMHQRLHPSELHEVEAEAIADGRLAAQRTRDWIDRSEWIANAEELPLMYCWAAHVRALAQSILDETEQQRPLRFASAGALTRAIFLESTLTEDIRAGFEEMTTYHLASHRESLAMAIFATGQRPSADAVPPSLAEALANAGVSILALTDRGWDIRCSARGGT
jgi:hypothetical protein